MIAKVVFKKLLQIVYNSGYGWHIVENKSFNEFSTDLLSTSDQSDKGILLPQAKGRAKTFLETRIFQTKPGSETPENLNPTMRELLVLIDVDDKYNKKAAAEAIAKFPDLARIINDYKSNHYLDKITRDLTEKSYTLTVYDVSTRDPSKPSAENDKLVYADDFFKFNGFSSTKNLIISFAVEKKNCRLSIGTATTNSIINYYITLNWFDNIKEDYDAGIFATISSFGPLEEKQNEETREWNVLEIHENQLAELKGAVEEKCVEEPELSFQALIRHLNSPLNYYKVVGPGLNP